jgi:hypothetical protein
VDFKTRKLILTSNYHLSNLGSEHNCSSYSDPGSGPVTRQTLLLIDFLSWTICIFVFTQNLTLHPAGPELPGGFVHAVRRVVSLPDVLQA